MPYCLKRFPSESTTMFTVELEGGVVFRKTDPDSSAPAAYPESSPVAFEYDDTDDASMLIHGAAEVAFLIF
jgi:hypothetical protein